ncbi:MAG: methyltransferase domain-containing protein, partial [Thioalkalivibrio sp.]|nr:methyltransferase domain-containing protein [Thioalkalivibrio sp.]
MLRIRGGRGLRARSAAHTNQPQRRGIHAHGIDAGRRAAPVPRPTGRGRTIGTGLRHRTLEPELMDDPALERGLHEEALAALARINRVSLTDRRILREVVRLARTSRHPLRVLDVGCGDGDVLLRVGSLARSRGVEVELHGCDISEAALKRARARAAVRGFEVALTRLDVTRSPLPEGPFSLVTCSLFLHHFSDADAAGLLGRMAAAGHTLLVQDLRRTSLGFVLAWLGVYGLTRSRVARVDGLRSVRAAFTVQEAWALCARAG